MWGNVFMIGLRPVSLIIRNPLICEALRRILNDNHFEVVSISDMIQSKLTDEGLIIVDRDLLPSEMFGELKALISSHPRSRVVVLSATFSREDAAQAFAAGSYAFLLSDTPLSECVDTIKLVSMGHKLAPPGLIDVLGEIHSAAPVPTPKIDMAKLNFTQREQEILRHLVRGSPNKVISRDLGISESAVKASVKCVLRKLSVQNRTQAAIIAHDSEFHVETSGPSHHGIQYPLRARTRPVSGPGGDTPELLGQC